MMKNDYILSKFPYENNKICYNQSLKCSNFSWHPAIQIQKKLISCKNDIISNFDGTQNVFNRPQETRSVKAALGDDKMFKEQQKMKNIHHYYYTKPRKHRWHLTYI